MLANPANASTTSISSSSTPLTKDKDLIMVKIKMEEQMVPSAGFSPPPSSEFYDYPDEYIGYQKQQLYVQQQQQQQQAQQPQQHQNQQQQQQQGFLAALDIDQFDMSLLDFDDIPIVPSPNCGSGSPTSYDGNWSTQLSLYAASPSEFRSFSPDCKPQLSPFLIHGSHDIHGSSVGEIDASKSVHQNQNQIQDGNGRNLLLRQCLEDLTFQKKHNFKPFEIEIPDNQQNAAAGSNSLAQAQEVEAMRELMAGFYGPNSNTTNTTTSTEVVGGNLELNQIFRQAFKDYRSDIENTCSLLSISPDPIKWSVSDVQAWLAYTLTTLQTSSDGPGRFASSANSLRQFWNLDGRSLCSLAEEEFRRRDPGQGEAIFAKLDLWKMLQQSSNPNNNQQQQGGKQQRPQVVQQQLEIKIDLDSQVAPSTPPQSLLAENFDLEQILGSSLLTTNGSGSVQSSPGIQQQQQQFVPSDLIEAIRSPASISSAYSSLSSETHHNMATDDDESHELDAEEEPMDTSRSKSSLKVGKKVTKNSSSIKGSIPTGGGGHKGGAHIHLWQFLKELLSSPAQHGACIRWLDQPRGVFKIEDSVRVARLWGLRKNRPAMNYDKLSRSIRQYYRKGIMRKTERSQRLVYQFCHPYGL